MSETQVYATLLTDVDDRPRIADRAGDPLQTLIEETTFPEDVVLVAQTGWGSGSVRPHIKRIEETAEGLHAYGCYRRPCGGTTDVTVRSIAARVPRPDTLATATVSLTIDPDHQVTFDTSEGVVTVTEGL
jgi:hypothetical protein